MRRINVWPWLRPFLILVLVVSIPPLLYWFGYVQHSVQVTKRQAHTTLAAVSTNFRGRLLAHDQMVSKAKDGAKLGVGREKRDADLQQKRLEIYLHSLLQMRSSTSLVEQTSGAFLHISTEGRGLGMDVPFDACSGERKCAVRAYLPLESLVPWQIVDTEFDGLLIVNEAGMLVAQDRRLPVQPSGLPVSAMERGQPIDFSGYFKAGQKPSTAAASGQPPLISPLNFSGDPTVRIAGVEYLAFIQPISVATTLINGAASKEQNDGRIRLLVVGLMSQERLRQEAIELSPQTLIVVSSLVAFGVFAIPFLKLRFIDPHERMRRRDMWLFSASILASAVLLVLLAFNVHALFQLQSRFDDALGTFTHQVRTNLSEEQLGAVNQLYALAPSLLSERSPVVSEQAVEGAAPPPKRTGDLSALDPEGSVLSSSRSFQFPEFEAMFATDIGGMQLRKWMPRTVPTPQIRSGVDTYLPAALSLPLAAAGSRSYTFNSTVAPTSGLLLGIFAAPRGERDVEIGPQIPFDQRAGVVAIATPMRAVNAPVVPQPFQFVLLDESGVVLFQQARGPYRDERFFDAVQGGFILDQEQNARKLEGVAFAKLVKDEQRKLLGTFEYRGHVYRMTATAVPELNAVLVSYYDKRIVSALAARMFGTAALFAVLVVVVVLASAAVAMMWYGGRALEWAWPSPSRAGCYVIGTSLAVLLGLSILALQYITSSFVFAWILVLLPAVLVLALGHRAVTRALSRLLPKTRQRIDDAARTRARVTSTAFQLFAVMISFVLIILPTALAYRDAYTLHLAAFQDSVQKRWQHDVGKWKKNWEAPVTRVPQAMSKPSCVGEEDVRCVSTDRIYATPDNYTRLMDSRDRLSIYRTCIADAPTVDTPDASSPPACKLVVDVVQPSPWSFTVHLAYHVARFIGTNPESVRSLARLREQQTDRSLLQTSSVARSMAGYAWWTHYELLLAMAFVVLVLSLLISSVAKHVLGLGLATNQLLDRHRDFKAADATRWLVLHPGSAADDLLKSCTDCIDLRHVAVEKLDVQLPGRSRVLCLHRIDAKLSELSWREALLRLVSADVEGCLVLTSEIDPFEYLSQRLREKEDELRETPIADANARTQLQGEIGQLRTEIASWACALQEVWRVRDAIDRGMHTEQVRPELLLKLQAECGWSQSLMQIAERLMARGDLDDYSWREIVTFIGNEAEPYYRSLWELCSSEERLVLIQLAQEGLVNPKRLDIAQRLARRRLVIVDPRFKIVNESLARFVITAEPPERVTRWEHSNAGGAWSRLGAPIYALAAVVITIILFTEQATFTSILAMATGAAGSLATLRGLYANVTKVTGDLKVA